MIHRSCRVSSLDDNKKKGVIQLECRKADPPIAAA
jgi:hypothetical protein